MNASANAYCDCSNFPVMTRLHMAHANRFYLCQRCDAIREDIYQDGAITRQVWHDSPDALSSDAARQEVERVLRITRTEQLELKL